VPGGTFAATGDLIYLRPMLATMERQSPQMLALLRGADVGVIRIARASCTPGPRRRLFLGGLHAGRAKRQKDRA
jgi:hypothetical protein